MGTMRAIRQDETATLAVATAASPATLGLDAVRSAQRYWQDHGWVTLIDLIASLRRWQEQNDPTRQR
jgi:hypothetical protein